MEVQTTEEFKKKLVVTSFSKHSTWLHYNSIYNPAVSGSCEAEEDNIVSLLIYPCLQEH